MFVSAVIPVHNERRCLGILYNDLKSLFEIESCSYEIIFVDDGSTDGSHNVLADIQQRDRKVKVLNLGENKGKGNALFAGFKAASGSHIITIDADLQICTSNTQRILKELKHFDAVITYRINRIESDGLLKFISSQIANSIRNMFLEENYKDTGSSLCGYKTEHIRLLPHGSEFDVFITSLLDAYGFSIKEIPIHSFPRRFGISHYNIWNRILKKFVALLEVRRIKLKIKRSMSIENILN